MRMKRKQTKHFVLEKDGDGVGIPACNCFQKGLDFPNLAAFSNEIAKTRRDTTCKNCRRTKIFRKVK